MTDLARLYQEVILDHYRRPRNFTSLKAANRQAEGHNPLCGDRVTVYLEVDGDRVREASFEGAGCAISTASASLMTEAVKGKSLAEAGELFRRFHDMLTGDGTAATDLGKLEAFCGVREIPIRVKCATLAWHALKAALEDDRSPAAKTSTE